MEEDDQPPQQEQYIPNEYDDNRKLGPSTQLNISEYAETAPAAEVDNRPLNVRIVDKNWKTRATAYEDLTKQLQGDAAISQNTEFFDTFAGFLDKMTTDSNASALDGGFETALVFADMAPPGFMKVYAEKLTTNTIDKAFGVRASTLQKGKALLLKLIEIDDPSQITPILLSKLNDKKPKVPPTCLEVIREGVVAFGAKAFPIKEILPTLAPVFNGVNSGAREAAMELILELSKWIGVAPFHSLLESIRPVQKADFEKAVSDREALGPMPLAPTIWLRSQRPKPGSEAVVQLAKSSRDNDREFLEEIDLAKKLRATDYQTLIADEKWSEQLKALTLVIDTIGPVPKLKAGTDVGDVVAVCKGFLRQGHVQLQVSSLKIVSLLANGLRNDFSATAKSLSESVIGKSKEKRLCPDVQACLISFLKYCLNYDSISEELNDQIVSKKNPVHSRAALLDLVLQALTEVPEKFSTDSFRPLAEKLASCFDDPDPKIRESSVATLTLLSQLIKSKGKAAIDAQRYMAGLETAAPKLFKKLTTSASSGVDVNDGGSDATEAVVSSRPTTATSTTGTATGAPKGVGLKPRVGGIPSTSAATTASTTTSNPASKSTKSALPSTGTTSSSSGGVTKKPAGNTGNAAKEAAAAAAEDDNMEELSMTLEDAEQALAVLDIPNWSSGFQTNMASAKWQDKVEAVTALGQKITEAQAGGRLSGPLIVYLNAKTSGFKISNVNILKAVLQTCCEAAKNIGDGRFSKPAAWELIRNFGDKYADKKTKELVDTLLSSLCTAVQPNFVVKRMKFIMDKCKAPLAHQHFLEWLKEAVAEFGVASFPVPFLGGFCREELENKIAAVRTAAVEAMGAMYHQIGPRFQAIAIAEDMKPQLKALLEAEFAKVGFDPAAAAAKATTSGAAEGSAIPRQDIMSLVDKAILTELNFSEGKTSWQNRKAAIESIIGACERSGHYLDAKPSLMEIAKALKLRLNDTQANLKPLAAAALGHVIASIEPVPGGKILRYVAEDFLGGLADNKKGMRDATTAALQVAVTLNKADPHAVGESSLLGILLPAVGESLSTAVIGRLELLQWLLPHVEGLRPEHGCNEHITPPLVTCLQDKTATVRAATDQLLTALMTRGLVSRVSLDKNVRDLPPASKRGLQPIIDKLMQLSASANSNGNGNTVAASAPPKASVAEQSLPAPRSGLPLSKPPSAPSSAHLKPPGVPAPTTTATTTSMQAQAQSAVDSSDEATTVGEEWFLKKTTKTRRLDDGLRGSWPQPPEEPSEHELVAVRGVWEPLLVSSFAALLFPDVKFGPINQDHVAPAMNDLCTQFDAPASLWLNHSDLIIKYLSCCLCLRETSGGMIKILQAILLLFLHLKRENYQLHELEIACLLPHIIDKSGHKSDRPKLLFKQVLSAATEIIAPTRCQQLFLQGLSSKNKKSRVICLEEMQRIVETVGAASLGKPGIREIGVFLESKDNEPAARVAALELTFVVYLSLGSDVVKLLKLLGDLSARTVTMVEDRIKQKHHRGSGASNSSGSASLTSTTAIAPTTTTTTHPTVQILEPIKTTTRQQVSTPGKPKPGTPTRQNSNNGDNFSDDAGGFASLSGKSNVSRKGATAATTTDDMMKTVHRSPRLDVASETLLLPSTLLPPRATTTGEDHGFRLPGLCGDIVEKIDFLLDLPRKQQQQQALSVSEEAVLSTALEECRDYIKILHSLLIGEWSQEGSTSEEEDMLKRSANTLAAKLIRCISFAFHHCHTNNNNSNNSSNGVFSAVERSVEVDVALVAVSVAALFALLKRPELVASLAITTIADIYKHILFALVDPRLNVVNNNNNNNAANKEGSELSLLLVMEEELLSVVKQVVKGLNTVLLRLSSDLSTDKSFSILIPLLVQSTLAKQGNKRSDNGGKAVGVVVVVDEEEEEDDVVALAAIASPLCRLLRRVALLELQQQQPFQRPHYPTQRILQQIHSFFSQCATTTTTTTTEGTQDIGYVTMHALTMEITAKIGATATLSLLQMSSNIHLPTSLLATIVLQQQEKESQLEQQQQNALKQQQHAQAQERMMSLIEEITTVRDKVAAIKSLRQLQQQQPELDLHAGLQQMSSAFRRFVIDTLNKLDKEEEQQQRFNSNNNENSGLTALNKAPTTTTTTATTTSKMETPPRSTTSKITTLKYAASNINNNVASPMATNRSQTNNNNNNNELSPRSRITEKVRNSLTTLTSSLDLEPTNNGNNNNNNKGNGSAGKEDLAARLARLRSKAAEL